MKNTLQIISFITFFSSLSFPFFSEFFLLRSEMLYILILFSGLTSFGFIIYWYFPILKSESILKNPLEEFKKQIHSSPKIISNYVPKFADSHTRVSLRALNLLIAEECLSSIYFGVAMLGLSGQIILWTSDIPSLTSGVFGSVLKYAVGRSLFSAFSVYFVVFGSSIFFLGCISKIFSWRYK